MNRTLFRLIWPLVTLVLLILVNALITENFFQITSGENGQLRGIWISILLYGSRVMLLAMSMTLVIATGGVDLSVGALMAMAGTVAAVLLNDGHSIPVAVSAAFAICMLGGLINGILIANIGIQPIIATLVLMVSGRGVAQLIAEYPILTITNKDFFWLSNGFYLGLPVPIWFVILFFILIWLLARRTALGVMTEALGDNSEAARYVGIPVRMIKISAYILSGICAAMAGLIDAAGVTAADTYNSGLNLELDAILAVVIGGTALTGGRFYLVGSFIGAVLIQLLTTTLLVHGFNSNILTLPKAILVIVVCTLQSPKVSKWIQSVRASRAVKVAA